MKAVCQIIEHNHHHARDIYRDIHQLFVHYHIVSVVVFVA